MTFVIHVQWKLYVMDIFKCTLLNFNYTLLNVNYMLSNKYCTKLTQSKLYVIKQLLYLA